MFPMYPYPEYDGNLTDVIESKFSELTTGVVPNRTEEHASQANEGIKVFLNNNRASHWYYNLYAKNLAHALSS